MLVIDKQRHDFKLDEDTVLHCVTPSNMEIILLSQRYSKDGKIDPEVFGGENYVKQAEFLIEAMKLFVVDWTGVKDPQGKDVPYSPELLAELPLDCFPRFVTEILNPAMEKVTGGGLEKNLEAT